MKIPSPLRLVLSTIFVTAVAGLVWWLVGYQVGKLMLTGADGAIFRRSLGFDAGTFLRLAFFALAGGLAVAAEVRGKWIPLAGPAFGTALLYPDHELGATIGAVLFVLCATGLAEAGDWLPQAALASAARGG